jgi:glycosyltransferase involved in cell wall biosynthesis
MNLIDYTFVRYVYPEFTNKKIDYIQNLVKHNDNYIKSIKDFYKKYPDFNYNIYLKLNKDLNIGDRERIIIYHFIKYGIHENRPYKISYNDLKDTAIENTEDNAIEDNAIEDTSIEDTSIEDNATIEDTAIEDTSINNIKVSIIITLYNHENYIIECIMNALNQTHKNIEVLIIDDCSTDNSYNLVNDFILNNDYDNISLFKTDINRGCYYARNIGINNSTGSYIAFQDADDLSLSTRIADMLHIMHKYNKSIVFSNIYRIKYLDIPTDIINKDDKLLDLCKEDLIIINLLFKNKSIHSQNIYDLGMVTSIIDKNLYDIYGLYNDNMRHSSDLEFIERVYCLKYNIDPFSIKHMYSFIKENNNDLIYYENNNFNYICRKMNSRNNTLTFNEKERNDYMNLWKQNIFNKIKFC